MLDVGRQGKFLFCTLLVPRSLLIVPCAPLPSSRLMPNKRVQKKVGEKRKGLTKWVQIKKKYRFFLRLLDLCGCTREGKEESLLTKKKRRVLWGVSVDPNLTDEDDDDSLPPVVSTTGLSGTLSTLSLFG